MKRRNLPPAGFPRSLADGTQISWVRTSQLSQYCNPFKGCWSDLEEPLSVREVEAVLLAGREDLQAPFTSFTDLCQLEQTVLRDMHARKVAWFAKHGFQQPLHVDVGVPSLGCFPGWLVNDGNHRLAAGRVRIALLGEDPWLPLAISGSLAHAQDLGLLP